MAHTCPGEAPRVPQWQEILPTSNLNDENLILMPSFSNDLFDTETTSDQTDQTSPLLPIHVFNTHRYTHLPHSHTQQTARQLHIH